VGLLSVKAKKNAANSLPGVELGINSSLNVMQIEGRIGNIRGKGGKADDWPSLACHC
jgi:hypothetical protein